MKAGYIEKLEQAAIQANAVAREALQARIAAEKAKAYAKKVNLSVMQNRTSTMAACKAATMEVRRAGAALQEATAAWQAAETAAIAASAALQAAREISE